MFAETLLAASAAAVLYIVAGYPLLLLVWKRRKAPPVRKDLRYRPAVSVVMAVYNGERFLRDKIESLLALNYPSELLEFLVVSDGSTDRTDAIAESYSGRGIRLLRAPRGGKAAALNAGLRRASGEIVFFTDVRQQLDPDALSHLAANFADPAVGAVTGELRYLGDNSIGEQADMQVYWNYELWVRRRHSEIDSIFGATGCIYAVRRSLIEPLPLDTLSDDAIIPLRAFFKKRRIVFDPNALAYDYRTAEGHEFRRRLRTLAGLWQVHTRIPELFGGSNRMRLHFLSHKFTRLLLPWALLLVWVSTAAMRASVFRSVLMCAYGLAALLAAADFAAPRRSVFKRLTSPFRTFLAMNAAALLAVVVFFIPPGKLWGTTRVKVEAESGPGVGSHR